MATHYEVLGVPSDASQEAIRRAFTDLARRYHPDKQATRTVAERIVAERRIREANAAWDALGTPAKRARYDATLRGPAATARPTQPARTSPVRPGSFETATSQSGVVVPAGAAPFLRVGPVLLAVVVLVGILVFTAYANYQGNVATDVAPSGQGRMQPWTPGRCLVLASADGRTTPIPTSCSALGSYAVASVEDLGRPCLGGAQPFDITAERTRLCLRPSGPVPG